MSEFDTLFNLFIKDYMFITFTTENSKGYLDLAVIGHTTGLEEV